MKEVLVRMYDGIQKKEAGQGGDSGSSGKRSQMEDGGVRPESRRHVERPTKSVRGSAILAAAAAADHSHLDPVSYAKRQVEDPTGTRAAAEAERIRLCAAALARFQFTRRQALHLKQMSHGEAGGLDRRRTLEDLDTLERIEPWPGARLEDLGLMIGMLELPGGTHPRPGECLERCRGRSGSEVLGRSG